MMRLMAKARHTALRTRADNPLPQLVRERLMALGDFGHLRVALRGDHIVIEQPAPPDDPDGAHPVLRLSGIGGFRFGLSLLRHTGRWQPIPISGALNDVLAEAVQILGPWLARDPFSRGTSGTVY